ncbi:MAG: crotonase/enoyl-CoA hydratase family protein [Pseudomonadota bacterium]
MTDLVSVAEHDTHTIITMDDGKANALSFAMFEAVNGALDHAESNGKVLVINGRPGKFSAGFDLSVMGKADQETVRLLRCGVDLAIRLLKFPTPVVLGVTGHSLAMGALLCLSADYRIGMRGAYKLGLNEAAIGMTLPWFGVELARYRLTMPHYSKCVGLAQVLDPDGAVEAGFLDEAVDEEAHEERVNAVAVGLSALDMTAHAGCKERAREPLFAALEAALARDFEAA